jgi:hypothetical protein
MNKEIEKLKNSVIEKIKKQKKLQLDTNETFSEEIKRFKKQIKEIITTIQKKV